MMNNLHRSTLIGGCIYHIFNRSIAGFKIFNNYSEFLRMQQTIKYYRINKPKVKFSEYAIQKNRNNTRNTKLLENGYPNKESLVNIIAYCIMPTHIHLILKQVKENGISIFMSNTLNSYSRYFNTKYKRKGPLWEGRFKRILVIIDEHLLHLTRYIHLNPVTAYLVSKPEEWAFSSYNEYIGQLDDNGERICNFEHTLKITPHFYKRFVEDNINYQRELAKIKSLIFDHDSTS